MSLQYVRGNFAEFVEDRNVASADYEALMRKEIAEFLDNFLRDEDATLLYYPFLGADDPADECCDPLTLMLAIGNGTVADVHYRIHLKDFLTVSDYGPENKPKLAEFLHALKAWVHEIEEGIEAL